MVQGQPRFLPCTPHGVLQMLRRSDVPTAGQHAVVIGRSDIVGKPMAALLAQRGWDSTVTLAHSRTPDLPAVCRSADILVAAVGRPRMVGTDWIDHQLRAASRWFPAEPRVGRGRRPAH